jgi:hypothetical protein
MANESRQAGESEIKDSFYEETRTYDEMGFVYFSISPIQATAREDHTNREVRLYAIHEQKKYTPEMVPILRERLMWKLGNLNHAYSALDEMGKDIGRLTRGLKR